MKNFFSSAKLKSHLKNRHNQVLPVEKTLEEYQSNQDLVNQVSIGTSESESKPEDGKSKKTETEVEKTIKKPELEPETAKSIGMPEPEPEPIPPTVVEKTGSGDKLQKIEKSKLKKRKHSDTPPPQLFDETKFSFDFSETDINESLDEEPMDESVIPETEGSCLSPVLSSLHCKVKNFILKYFTKLNIKSYFFNIYILIHFVKCKTLAELQTI